ncbi:hypothetical protein COSHB9_04350 [Companilactobacillus alimentarius]|uniref:Uncharacterized protein n=1 Tax=Companilactobacillus alimentarius DSM 20249 TaxID=1423720 RepID=A0A2K9HJY4_9LACO|nr:hypothetical protein [Companilactobacillus alimentarius]AUI72027.1 hypothetical protein LA20249_07485 [Companilactobacillus alimentarius DSM 20249]KRK77980.1 hypothetical protein FC67_GL001314 [Companilactobacillus alimentarius DSM 20249]MDT6952562.1 hypothetical protein [Companilactobacillus alimentarius]GEO44798.1 hypothetical protein LAL01_10300 [Companilactobacillus alimentarius]
MKDRTFVNPEKFALGFASASVIPNSDKSQTVSEAKKYLLNYLTAYYLVEEFNTVENKNFDSNTETHFEDMTFPQLMERVKKMNKY